MTLNAVISHVDFYHIGDEEECNDFLDSDSILNIV